MASSAAGSDPGALAHRQSSIVSSIKAPPFLPSVPLRRPCPPPEWARRAGKGALVILPLGAHQGIMLLFLIPTSGVLSSSLSHLCCLDLLVLLLLLLLDGRVTRVLPGGHLGDGVDEVRLLVPFVEVYVLNTCMVRGTSGSRGVSVCHALQEGEACSQGSRGVSVCHALHEGEARSQGSRHSACMRIIFKSTAAPAAGYHVMQLSTKSTLSRG